MRNHPVDALVGLRLSSSLISISVYYISFMELEATILS